MKKTVTILLLIFLSACSNLPIFKARQPPIIFPVANTPVSPLQTTVPGVYNNSKYGYSLTYPGEYSIVAVTDEFVEIGNKITVEVMSIDPTAPRGDGVVIESDADIQFSGYPAKSLTGYIGSVGGYMPQQFKQIIVERNGNYFVLTLYALGLHVTDGDVSQIAQLMPEDVALFDEIEESMQIP